jgi:hypothetical protein
MVEPLGTRPPDQAATEEGSLATKLHIAEPRPVGFHNSVMAFEMRLGSWPTVVMLLVGTR